MSDKAKKEVSEEIAEVIELVKNSPPRKRKIKYDYILIGVLVTAVFIGTWFFTKPDCNIKGNIDRDGKRYYYTSIDRYYKQVKISNPGERFFCTEREAIEAGFTRKHFPKSLESLGK